MASCVVFRNGKPARSEYRHFNVKTVVGADDFASMREIVHRRYSRLLEEDNNLPDLIIVDGGKGQLSSAYSVLKELGIGVTMTAIFTPTQALMAAKAGADFVAPYVNRLDNIIGDGTAVVAEIVSQLENYGMDCKVLAASFKNAEQVHKCASMGCHSVTVTDDIMKLLISHPMTDAAIAGFEKDWQGVYGDKTILDF